jgi:ATP-dependent Clp protease adaptor protein ClpS
MRKIEVMGDTNENSPDIGGELLEDVKDQLKEPEMYVVVLHNDHYTTMDFVVTVLVEVFHKSTPEATKIMLDVHKKGKGLVGTFPYDIAATKVAQVREMAKKAEYPLKCTIEKA